VININALFAFVFVMKSIYFPCSVSPTPCERDSSVKGRAIELGAPLCQNVVMEGVGISSACTLMEKAGEFCPGEEGLGMMMAKAYGDMALRLQFLGAGSAMPFCLSTQPQGGHYFLYVPSGANASTPVLLLLHGYGGNLLYFPWAIWKEVPDCILIAPSWQINWSDGSYENRRDYVKAALADAEAKVGFPLSKPWLVPLSQGGETAFSLAARETGWVRGVLGISTTGREIPTSVPVHLLCGDADARFRIAGVENSVAQIQSAGGNASLTTIKDASHFLLLSHRTQMGAWLREKLDCQKELE